MAMTTDKEARKTDVQHRKPCHDCPWRRKALAGWLGGNTADAWIRLAHSDARVPCHTNKGRPQPQCVGLATYRANVLKLPRDPEVLRVEPDRENVFATPAEFTDYHSKRGV